MANPDVGLQGDLKGGTGGGGADVLRGDEGRDVFIYQATGDSGIGAGNRDSIEDFDAGGAATAVDKIDVSNLVLGTFSYLGDSSTAFSGGSDNTEARFNASTKILEIDSDGDASADMEIKLSSVTDANNLDRDDFTTT